MHRHGSPSCRGGGLVLYTVGAPLVQFTEDPDPLNYPMHLKILYGKLDTLHFMTVKS